MKKYIVLVYALASFALLHAQPDRTETAQRPTPGYDWKFEFINMDVTPVLLKVVNTANTYFDPELNIERPTDLFKPTKIPGTSLNSGIHYGHLRSTLNLAKYSSVALVILYEDNGDLWEAVYELHQPITYMPVTFMWHGGELEMEIARNSFITLQSRFNELRHVKNWTIGQ